MSGDAFGFLRAPHVTVFFFSGMLLALWGWMKKLAIAAQKGAERKRLRAFERTSQAAHGRPPTEACATSLRAATGRRSWHS